MKKSQSYSLQKVNPNLIKPVSRIQRSPKSRLNFPANDDSRFKAGVGRKHYEQAAHVIQKMLLNGDSTPSLSLSGNKSEQSSYKPNPQNIPNHRIIRPAPKQSHHQYDSLSKFEQQFNKKISIQHPSSRNFDRLRGNDSSSEVVNRKNSDSSSRSHFRIFGNAENSYEFLKNMEQQSPNNIRKYNPTYLSSNLNCV